MEDDIPFEFRRCVTGKIKYASATDARKAVRGGAGGYKKGQSGIKGTPRTYRCWHCESFHIASGRSNR